MKKCKLEECTNLTKGTYCSRSCSNIGRHRDPEFSSRFSQSIKNSYTDELKSIRSESAVEMWKDPDYREFHTQRIKDWWKVPENVEWASRKSLDMWSNSEIASKLREYLVSRNKSDASRHNISLKMTRLWRDSYRQMYLAVHGNPQKKMLDDDVYFYVFESDDGKYIKIGEGNINRLMVRLVTFHKPPSVLVRMVRQDALSLEKSILEKHLLVTSKDDIPMDMYHSGKGEIILSDNLDSVIEEMGKFITRPPEYAIYCLLNELTTG